MRQRRSNRRPTDGNADARLLVIAASGRTTAPPPSRLCEHISRTLRLALPVTLARAGLLALTVVDTAMTGHAGADQLAFYAIASAPQIFIQLLGIGLLLGTVVLTAQADGAGRPATCGTIWRVALLQASAYGLIQCGLLYGGSWFLAATGQSPLLAEAGGQIMIILGWSSPAMLLFIATTLFLEGIGRTTPGLVVMVLANLLNGVLNWLLIFGHGGLPAMGADGAALATTIVRWFMFLALLGYTLQRVDRQYYGIKGPLHDAGRIGRILLRIGYPMALTQAMESGGFSAMTLFAGLLGPVELASFQIVMTLISLSFMCSLGFATAASIRVGNAIGRNDQPGIRVAGWTAAGLAVSALLLLATLLHLLPRHLISLYTDSPQVIDAATAALSVAALVLIPDGLQAVLNGALRGAADVWPATGLFLIAFWGLMIPAGYLLGVRWHGGASGLVEAIVLGTTCAALMLAGRFRQVSARPIREL